MPLAVSRRRVRAAQVEFRFGGDGEPVGPWAHRLVDEFYGEDVDEGDAEMNALGAAEGAAGGGGVSFGAPQGDASIGFGPPPTASPPAATLAPGPVGRGSAAAVLPAWMTGGAPASMP